MSTVEKHQFADQTSWLWALWPMLLILLGIPGPSWSSGDLHAVHREYPEYLPAPGVQSQDKADRKSKGCVSCHTESDQKTMHQNPGVILGCTDCHGGDAEVFKPEGSKQQDKKYFSAQEEAHVLPLHPEQWNYPSSATAERTYSLLNLESPEFIRFINPGDYRIAREACGACHLPEIRAAERSLMATTAMLWGGASYNNGILPFKRYVIGEAYTRDGVGAIIKAPVEPTKEMSDKGILPLLAPLPTWEVLPATDIFRIFERGGRNIGNLFAETGLPNALGQIQRLEEPGRPDVKQSSRARGTGARIVVPVINIYKTRLNDPTSWFFGTNEQPGDYRSSGCSACHVIYANDRDPKHSGPYAQFGHDGTSQTKDPTIAHGEPSHPLKHEFTRAIPTSQCMICHMHQPNVFVNSYMGYTMWDYESDAPLMWPKKQLYPNSDEVRPGADPDPEQILGHAKVREINERNPEEAAIRGLWSDPEFLKKVSTDINPKAKDTQFADYHGHGWNFRAIYKRDRHGTLLDKDGKPVSDDDPKKFQRAVHMSSIHMDVGMHCVDCHFAQDAHGNGHIYGEVAQAIEIDCIDCHGTVDEYPTLKTSGPAAPEGGNDLSLLRVQDGRARFEWRDGKLYQRSALDPEKEWELSMVKDFINPDSPHYNAKAARAKTVSKDLSMEWGLGVAKKDLAHPNEEMTCFACHSSWITGCAGCHLPIQANWKTRRHHYDYDETRNYATYNPQVVRDQMYQLGRHGPAKGNRITPVRSSSALILSSKDANRQKIYIQQPPIAASGFSSQAFAPHFAHTVRTTETKTCTDCHLSEKNDNNAIMAQLLLQGTNFVNFVGYNAWVGTESSIEGIQVTEWEEPQAVIGSFLHKYAYPDWYKDHQEANQELQEGYAHNSGRIGCLQLRGEYLYVADASKGMEAMDVANIANKGFSQRFITAPFSPLGHDTVVESKHATCVALPTDQPIHPDRQHSPGFGLDGKQMENLMRSKNLEQDFHPIYNYAFIVDSEEGLILTDINTLADGEARNNFLTRALTWNENGVLDGARHITVAGHFAYIAADAGLVILNIDDPLHPVLVKVFDLPGVRASAVQFRYAFVTDATGVHVIDITIPEQPKLVPNAHVPIADARKIYLARTYAYVAAKSQGLAIIDVEQPENPKLYRFFNANGKLNDAEDVVVASTNASLLGYVADGRNGLKVLQLTSPETQPKFYGFSPEPKPQLIAWYPTEGPAMALSKGLDRDRAVDETGGQIAVFGRVGARPFNREEMEALYLDKKRRPWFVTDKVENDKRIDTVPDKRAGVSFQKHP